MNTSFFAILFMSLTIQLMSYGFAGLFSKLLVNSPYMWYPFVLSDVSFYRTLREDEEFVRPKGGVTKFQFFIISSIISFAYYMVPGYFFPSIAALSFVCWVWKDSVIAQLIGSGRNGFGMGSFTLDWASISFIGHPLILPLSTIINMMAGFILFYYVVTPLAYWFNLYNAQRFPFSSTTFYQYNGQAYNISRIINEQDLTFNQEKYENYSNIYLGVVYLFSIGFALATLSHFCLFHGRETWKQFKQALNNSSRAGDIDNRLMNKHPPSIFYFSWNMLVDTFEH
ncbi:oligopeptide transporter 1-like [Carica papaya]|uniref:oligopeptide transporter 1-like n=1 Tax=Carica papaya TaxID=3649 RepID=UPI000B8CA7F2|nr:oligopeptide transporter 1-like [Carica papaya]